MVLMACLVFLATLLTLGGLYLFQFFSHPLAQAEGGANLPASWDGSSPVNFAWLVIQNESPHLVREAAILHLDPTARKAVLIKIDPEMQVDLARGFGRERIAASFALGELAKPSRAMELALSALSKAAALPLAGYFLTDERGLQELSENLGALPPSGVSWAGWSPTLLLKFPRIFTSLRRNVRTNVTFVELWRISRFLFGLSADHCLETEDLTAISELCADERIRADGEGILILNGTKVPGLASRAARWVENLGGKVLAVGNAPEQSFSYSMILTRGLDSYTASALARAFGISDLRGKGETLRWEKRGDIVLILGLDKVDSF